MPKNKVYDGEELTRVFCQWGTAATYPRLAEYARMNMTNPKTGGASMMGVVYAMKRWMFHNPEKAFEYWKEREFNLNPDKQFTFEDFIRMVLDWAIKSVNVSGKSEIHRFCAKYGIEMDYRVRENDIVQVTRKDHSLFQTILVVDNVDGRILTVYSLTPGGNRTNHQVSVKDVGVCGRVIV